MKTGKLYCIFVFAIIKRERKMQLDLLKEEIASYEKLVLVPNLTQVYFVWLSTTISHRTHPSVIIHYMKDDDLYIMLNVNGVWKYVRHEHILSISERKALTIAVRIIKRVNWFRRFINKLRRGKNANKSS